jgi:hypothetical protein
MSKLARDTEHHQIELQTPRNIRNQSENKLQKLEDMQYDLTKQVFKDIQIALEVVVNFFLRFSATCVGTEKHEIRTNINEQPHRSSRFRIVKLSIKRKSDTPNEYIDGEIGKFAGNLANYRR